MALRIDRDRIKRQLNPLARVRSAVRHNPLPVFATTAAVAFLITLLRRRRKRDDRPFKARRMLFGWFLALAKPAARLWIANWAKDRFLPLPPPFQPTDRANTP
jgi:hypothetical protein